MLDRGGGADGGPRPPSAGSSAKRERSPHEIGLDAERRAGGCDNTQVRISGGNVKADKREALGLSVSAAPTPS